MKNQVKLKPVFSFNEESLNQFDADLLALGYQYEGTLDGCLWMYRLNSSYSVNIQVGDGGVVAASICLTRGSKVEQTDLSLNGITDSKKLYNWIASNLGQPKKY